MVFHLKHDKFICPLLIQLIFDHFMYISYLTFKKRTRSPLGLKNTCYKQFIKNVILFSYDNKNRLFSKGKKNLYRLSLYKECIKLKFTIFLLFYLWQVNKG